MLDTLHWLKHETDVWFEITNLVIPHANDSADELRRMCDWILEERRRRGAAPLHGLPSGLQLDNIPATPGATLMRARRIAQEEGLQHVYTGNVHDTEGGTTFCPQCHSALIVRDWHRILRYEVTDDGRCPDCTAPLAGRFERYEGSFRSPRSGAGWRAAPERARSGRGG